MPQVSINKLERTPDGRWLNVEFSDGSGLSLQGTAEQLRRAVRGTVDLDSPEYLRWLALAWYLKQVPDAGDTRPIENKTFDVSVTSTGLVATVTTRIR